MWRLSYFHRKSMSCHATLCHAMPHHDMSHHITSHHITYIMPCHVTSCHIISHYVTSCHVMACHVHYSLTACLWTHHFYSLYIGRPSEIVVTFQACVYVILTQTKSRTWSMHNALVPLSRICPRTSTNRPFKLVRVIIRGHSSNDNDNDNRFEQRSSRACSFGRPARSFWTCSKSLYTQHE